MVFGWAGRGGSVRMTQCGSRKIDQFCATSVGIVKPTKRRFCLTAVNFSDLL
jgi:hypothetical protein